eukprot:2995442-Rhodomonas_salina.1
MPSQRHNKVRMTRLVVLSGQGGAGSVGLHAGAAPGQRLVPGQHLARRGPPMGKRPGLRLCSGLPRARSVSEPQLDGVL